ncbi:MAG: DUF59 domain-containing protein [Bacteroidales bacterium]|nr:DUF59 domain-containing protein [Bacteroidales bacterium]
MEETLKHTPETLRDAVIGVLRTIYDPEIPVNIYELGLVYDIDIDTELNVRITMTMTAPDCPEAEYMLRDVREMVGYISGVKSVAVELTFDPPWTPDKLSEATKLDLGML